MQRFTAASSAVIALLLVSATAAAEPFPLPIQTLAAEARSVTPDAYPAADRVTVWSMTDVTMLDSGESLRHEQTAAKALTEAGARQLKILRFDYDPASSDVTVVSVAVIRADGSVESVDVAPLLDLPAPKHMIYWTMRVKLLDLPRLDPGDTVVWETRFRGFQIAYLDGDEERFVPPQRGEFYDVVVFGAAWPVVRQAYRLTTPRSKNVQYAVYNGPLASRLDTGTDTTRLTFSLADIPAYPAETAAFAPSDAQPKVVLATLMGWPDKSRWFWTTNEPSFLATPEIDVKVREIIKGKKTDAERMTALNRWVAANIRYSGLSMGQGEGYTLHPATMTFRERCGVCKDKAGMLVAMMRSAGYKDTFAAMTMAGARVDDIPAEQFNHSVVAWRNPAGQFVLLDPTWAPLSRQDWSRAEAEQHYVVGTPTGEQLAITPPVSADDNALVTTVTSSLSIAGDLDLLLRLEPVGYIEDTLRRLFANRPADEWQLVALSMVRKPFPWAALTSMDVDSARIEDLDSRFAASLRFRVPSAAGGVESGAFTIRPFALSLPVPDPRTGENLMTERVDGRQRGILFRCAKSLRFKETLTLPYPSTMAAMPAIRVSNDLGSVTASASLAGDRLTLEAAVRFHTRSVPAASLAQYQALLDAIQSVRDVRLRIERQGAARAASPATADPEPPAASAPDATVDDLSVAVTVHADGRVDVRRRTVTTLRSFYAMNLLADPRIELDESRQTLVVHEARTTLPSGTTLDAPAHALNASTPDAVAAAPAFAAVTELVVTLIGIQRPCSVTLDYEIRDKAPWRPFSAAVIPLADRFPVTASQVTVTVPARARFSSALVGDGGPVTAAAPALRAADSTYTWTSGPQRGYRPDLPLEAAAMPRLVFSTAGDWDTALAPALAQPAAPPGTGAAPGTVSGSAPASLPDGAAPPLDLVPALIRMRDALVRMPALASLEPWAPRPPAEVLSSRQATPMETALLLRSLVASPASSPRILLFSRPLAPFPETPDSLPPVPALLPDLYVEVQQAGVPVLVDASDLSLDPYVPYADQRLVAVLAPGGRTTFGMARDVLPPSSASVVVTVEVTAAAGTLKLSGEARTSGAASAWYDVALSTSSAPFHPGIARLTSPACQVDTVEILSRTPAETSFAFTAHVPLEPGAPVELDLGFLSQRVEAALLPLALGDASAQEVSGDMEYTATFRFDVGAARLFPGVSAGSSGTRQASHSVTLGPAGAGQEMVRRFALKARGTQAASRFPVSALVEFIAANRGRAVVVAP